MITQTTGYQAASSEVRDQWECGAETADCNCPDPCERDHGND